MQLWFDAAAHQQSQGRHQVWGGLWNAHSAAGFVEDAVCMYMAEEEWPLWQQQGFDLLRKLYDQEARLEVVKVNTTRKVQRLHPTVINADMHVVQEQTSVSAASS